MAQPIAPTPKLDAKATDNLLRRIKKDLKKPVGPVKTPKLSKAVRLIRSNAQA